MKVKFYQAECGDSARLSYIGSDNLPHNIFIDAGYERTFHHVIKEEIQNIKNEGECIDLWIISHIHDDHIGGVIAYINAIKDGELTDIVQSWFYNPPRITLSDLKKTGIPLISEAKSISQGDAFAGYLLSENKLPDIDIIDSLPSMNFFGLKITVLSPNSTSLQNLRSKYPSSSLKPFERIEMDSISDAKSIQQYDYHIPLLNFDLGKWQQDDSIENGSSISVLTEYKGKISLWLADSHPSIIETSLRNLGYSKHNPLICDWVKVAHHGSNGNNSSELYEMIQCQKYLISANGENRYNLPTKECIARILLNNQHLPDSHYYFYFTYDNRLLRSMFDVDGELIFSKLNFSIYYHNGITKMIEV